MFMSNISHLMDISGVAIIAHDVRLNFLWQKIPPQK